MQQLAFVVEGTVTVKGRGVALTQGVWGTGEVRAGDTIEIRSAEGQQVIARVKKIDWQRRTDTLPPVVRRGEYGLVFVNLPEGSVKRGDEVWTT